MEKLSSRSLALALASGYLVGAALIGTALVTAQKEAPAALEPAFEYTHTTTATKTTTRSSRTTTRATTTTASVDYELVSGAYQLVTAIPEGWVTRRGDVETVKVARSAAHPGLELRFGGAPPEDPSKTLLQRITAAHEGKLGKNSYSMEVLRDLTWRGHSAVRWSYTTAPNGTAQFCTGAWWEADGIEYVLLVVSPSSDRAVAEKMLNLMTTHAKP